MPIQILSPQLANQIAAGEVVERPASVVKELVENAIDAGATKIELEIDKGGQKRILVRDNGKGVDKAQLALALSRHATSKISNLDDLEAIVSLGFRGEALASISSVSRLTFTSKPKAQSQAWQAMAEGSDMDVTVKPAAHPDGTSVEVVDLFFNTPARKKFLRADKTEFNHIDVLIKRIALSCPHIHFSLKHNGKQVRLYKAAKVEDNIAKHGKRIGDVIGNTFIDNSCARQVDYENVTIKVWIKQPQLCVNANAAQYAFVNGRMMKDKLIQHAIRQAYDNNLGPEQLPEYVVFIDLPPQDVDVNVHPAKHEVRFHYARLLHDLVVKAISEALMQWQHSEELELETPEFAATETDFTAQQRYQQAVENTQIEKPQLQETTNSSGYAQQQDEVPTSFSGLKPKVATQSMSLVDIEPVQQQSTTPTVNFEFKTPQQSVPTHNAAGAKVLFIEADRYIYCQYQQQLYLIDGDCLQDAATIAVEAEHLIPSPLLVPVRIKIENEEQSWLESNLELLKKVGFELVIHSPFVIIKQVPGILRKGVTGQSLPLLFNRLFALNTLNEQQLVNLIVNNKPQIDHQVAQSLLDQLASQQTLDAKLAEFGKLLTANELLNL